MENSDYRKSEKTLKRNAPLDDTTRTPGVKQRHANEKKQEEKKAKEKSSLPGAIENPVYDSLERKQQERMDHVEEAQIKGLFHRQKAEKGIKK